MDKENWPLLYNCFVDDTLSNFESEEQSVGFFGVLNGLHPALKFTVEKESGGELPFMDVLLKRKGNEFLRSVYRKPTFTGLYTRWDSYSPTGQNIGLIKALTTRAIRICSKDTLPGELLTLKNILEDNGYPSHVVEQRSEYTVAAFMVHCGTLHQVKLRED